MRQDGTSVCREDSETGHPGGCATVFSRFGRLNTGAEVYFASGWVGAAGATGAA